MEFTFKDNDTVEALDTVPEKYHGLYGETGDGKFTLQDPIKALVADYLGVSETLVGVRNDKKRVTDENAKRRLASNAVDELAQSLGLEIGDEGVADVLKTFVAELQGQVKGGKEIKINMDKVNADAERRIAAVTESKDAELAGVRGALSKHLVSDAATRALAEAKGSVELLLPHVLAACKMVPVDNGDYGVTVLDAQGDARLNSSGGFMGVAEFVAEMKTQDRFGRAFESETPSGGGTPPGSMNRSTIRSNMNNQAPMTPSQKIAEGIRKGQAIDGRGSRN